MEERGKIVQNLNIHVSLISLLSSKDKFYTNITLIEALWAIFVLTVLHSRRFKKTCMILIQEFIWILACHRPTCVSSWIMWLKKNNSPFIWPEGHISVIQIIWQYLLIHLMF